jgi:hypothetical protein
MPIYQFRFEYAQRKQGVMLLYAVRQNIAEKEAAADSPFWVFERQRTDLHYKGKDSVVILLLYKNVLE